MSWMPRIFPFLLLSLLSSCNTPTMVSVDGIAVKTGARLGGKEYVEVKKGDVSVVYANNNENSFREGAQTVKWGLAAWTASDIFRSGASAYTSVKNAKTAADVSKSAAGEVTKRAAISGDVEKARLATEVVQ